MCPWWIGNAFVCGTLLLDNLQFVSWLENRAKVDIKQDDWDRIKKEINYYL
jgi:hypothetical protein